MRRREQRRFYLFILPWLVGFVAFQAGPMLLALGVSFTDWLLVSTPEWQGLKHYRRLAQDDIFWTALKNSLYFAGVTVPVGIALAFGLALLLNREWTGMGIFRTIFFMPALVSGVALALVWGWLFNPRLGAVNALLRAFDLPAPNWLGDPGWAMPAIMLLSIFGIGGTMLIYLAGLQNIPRELYDAAKLDGAGWWSVTRHVTLPMISSVTFFLFVVGTIQALQLFTPTYVLTGGGPRNSTLTLPLYIYQNAFDYQRYGYASALTVVLLLLTLILTLLQLLFARRWVYYAGWGGR
jgi:multiple sugar transport system permease protein